MGARGPYIEGFLSGQVVAYCERVNRGSGLAAQIEFPREHTQAMVDLVDREGCKSTVKGVNEERVSLLIYRDDLVKLLFEQLESAQGPSELDIWSMGKLLGYGDHEVMKFIHHSRDLLATSTSLAVSSPPLSSDSSGFDTA